MNARRTSGSLHTLPQLLALALVCLVLPSRAELAAQSTSFRARLSPLPVDGRSVSTITGVGQVRATLDGNRLTLSGTYRGTSSPATGAHLHLAPPGQHGPVAAPLQVNPATREISGSMTLTSEQLAALRGRSLYVQLHTEGNPQGELRGWVFDTAIIGDVAANWAPTSLTVDDLVRDFVPVTDEMLANPDPADWLMIRGNYQAHSYSALDQIDAGNVGGLRLEWMWAMHDGSSEPAPIVYDGVIYLINPGNVIQALDARTGDLIWEHATGPDNGQDMRGIAIWQDRIIQATTDARIVALDARTGEQVWETVIQEGNSNSSGPIVADGKVISGMASCARYVENRCFISAYDAATGQPLWRFHTIAHAGEPGGDTWGDLDDIYRQGGETWITGSYDPELGLTYWGTAQAKPWAPVSRHQSIYDAGLYTNATVAVDVDTGALRWHFQHVPGEALDLDEVFERVLVDRDGRRLVLSIGKHGILWKNDRVTGEFLGATETVFQNAFTHIDPETGAITYRDDIVGARIGEWTPACPSSAGGKDWHSMSYHEPSGYLIAPLSQTCLENRAGGGRPRAWGRRPRLTPARFFEMPGSDGNLGQARRLRREHPRGGVELRAARELPHGRALHGGRRRLRRRPRPALPRVRRPHGEILWETRLGTSVQGHPFAFASTASSTSRDDRAGRDEPPNGAAARVARDHTPEDGQRALRVQPAGVDGIQPGPRWRGGGTGTGRAAPDSFTSRSGRASRRTRFRAPLPCPAASRAARRSRRGAARCRRAGRHPRRAILPDRSA
jgi:alcohol dehydrogenase (cytochrome c)